MTTALLQIPALMETQLKASPSIGVDENSIQRTKRRPVTREEAPAIHIRATRIDRTTGSQGKGDCTRRTLSVLVQLIVRDDDDDSFDEILDAVVERLAPGTAGTSYPKNVHVVLQRASVDEEMADEDVTRIDLEYEVQFNSAEHGLSIVT